MNLVKVDTLTPEQLDRLVAACLKLQCPALVTCPTCAGNGEVTNYGYGTIHEHARCERCQGTGSIPTPADFKWWPSYCTDPGASFALLECEIDVTERRKDYHYVSKFARPGAQSRWATGQAVWATGATLGLAAARCVVTYYMGEKLDLTEVRL